MLWHRTYFFSKNFSIILSLFSCLVSYFLYQNYPELMNILELDTDIISTILIGMLSLSETSTISSWCTSFRCFRNSSSSMSFFLKSQDGKTQLKFNNFWMDYLYKNDWLSSFWFVILEALATIDWFVLSWLKWYFTFIATVSTSCLVHFSWWSVSSKSHEFHK